MENVYTIPAFSGYSPGHPAEGDDPVGVEKCGAARSPVMADYLYRIAR